MAYKIRWNYSAITDLAGICDYIGKDSPAYAAMFAQKVFALVENLVIFPKSGRIVPEFGDERLRELIYKNYRLIYRIKGHYIEIAMVHHDSSLLSNA